MRDAAPNSLDEALLAFAVSWREYGGGSDEDIYVEFGLPSQVYFERLMQVIDSPGAANLDDTTREKVRQVCADRMRSPHRRE